MELFTLGEKCPQCGSQQLEGDSCDNCGVVFSKFRERLKKRSVIRKRRSRPQWVRAPGVGVRRLRAKQGDSRIFTVSLVIMGVVAFGFGCQLFRMDMFGLCHITIGGVHLHNIFFVPIVIPFVLYYYFIHAIKSTRPHVSRARMRSYKLPGKDYKNREPIEPKSGNSKSKYKPPPEKGGDDEKRWLDW